MFRPKPNPAKKRTSTRIQSTTLYAILADIEALHERVHELAYYQFERPLLSNGMSASIGPNPPAYPYAPPSPSSAGIPTWYSQHSIAMQDHPPLYTYPPSPPPPRYEKRRSRSPASPAPVFRRRGGFGAEGAHGTPKVTRAAPDRSGKRRVGKKERKRVRGRWAVEESEETEGSGSEESEESEDDGDEEMQGGGGRRDGRGGLGGRFGGRGVAV